MSIVKVSESGLRGGKFKYLQTPGSIPTVVKSGLEIYLDANDSSSWPGSGSTWYDISGNGRNHTLFNTGEATVDGAKSIAFIANGDKCQPASSTYTFGSNHSMVAWGHMLTSAQAPTWRTLWRTQTVDHPIIVQDNTGLIGYYDSDTATFNSYGVDADANSLENTWVMYTIVASGGTTTLYINDNQLSGSVSFTANGLDHDAIGNLNTSAAGNQYFGYVGAALIYSKALSLAEISQNYDAMKATYGIT